MSWLPLLPLDLALMPGSELPLHIFEPRYRKMVTRCMRDSIGFGVVRIHDKKLAPIGTEVSVVKVLRRHPDGRFDILTRSKDRFRIQEVREHADGHLEARVAPVEDKAEQTDQTLEDTIAKYYKQYADLIGDEQTEPPPRGPRWSFRVAARVRLTVDARQELLEMLSENDRMQRIAEHLHELIPMLSRRGKVKAILRGNGRLRGGTHQSPTLGSEGGST